MTYAFLRNSHEVLHLGSCKSYDYYRRHVFLFSNLGVVESFKLFLIRLQVWSWMNTSKKRVPLNFLNASSSSLSCMYLCTWSTGTASCHWMCEFLNSFHRGHALFCCFSLHPRPGVDLDLEFLIQDCSSK